MNCENLESILRIYLTLLIKNKTIGRSIKDEYSVNNEGNMTSEVTKWWEGLGRELEEDIESLDE